MYDPLRIRKTNYNLNDNFLPCLEKLISTVEHQKADKTLSYIMQNPGCLSSVTECG